jgi:hypothetical protein
MKVMYYVSSTVGNRHMCGVRIDGDVNSTEEQVLSAAFPSTLARINPRHSESRHEVCAAFSDPRDKVESCGTINRALDCITNIFVKLLGSLRIIANNSEPKWWCRTLGNYYINNDSVRKQVTFLATLMMLSSSSNTIEIDYVNYAGRREWRLVTMRWPPHYGSSKHHPESQWLLNIYCHDRDDRRTFAMTDILGWRKPT